MKGRRHEASAGGGASKKPLPSAVRVRVWVPSVPRAPVLCDFCEFLWSVKKCVKTTVHDETAGFFLAGFRFVFRFILVFFFFFSCAEVQGAWPRERLPVRTRALVQGAWPRERLVPVRTHALVQGAWPRERLPVRTPRVIARWWMLQPFLV